MVREDPSRKKELLPTTTILEIDSDFNILPKKVVALEKQHSKQSKC